MTTKKKKRKYTFRKGQIVPYESGSLMHKAVKAERERDKRLAQLLSTSKKTSKKRKRK